MDFEEKTEFKPCWGVIFCFYSGNNIITQKHLSLDACNFDIKPEITSRLINQINNIVKKEFNMMPIFVNFQIVWFDEIIVQK